MRQEQNSSICISIHALREEGDPTTPVTVRCMFLFLSTPSARRATRLNFRASSIVGYFYPRPPRGGRRAVHRPLRGREDISIHALREEGDRSSTTKAPTGTISIHALREEGDGCKLRNLRDVEAISIHALREEGDWRVR